MDTFIRERAETDISQLSDILLLVHDVDGYPVEGVSDPRAWLTLKNMLHAWVAIHNNRIVGHVGISLPSAYDSAAGILHEDFGIPLESIGVVQRLFVSPLVRNLGIGSELLETAMEYVKKYQRSLVLDVMEKDRAAIRAYKKHGWLEIGRFSHSVENARIPAVAFAYVEEYQRLQSEH